MWKSAWARICGELFQVNGFGNGDGLGGLAGFAKRYGRLKGGKVPGARGSLGAKRLVRMGIQSSIRCFSVMMDDG